MMRACMEMCFDLLLHGPVIMNMSTEKAVLRKTPIYCPLSRLVKQQQYLGKQWEKGDERLITIFSVEYKVSYVYEECNAIYADI